MTHDSEHENEHEPEGRFVRRKAKIQVGDGPDQRGEVTVELVDDRENLEGSFADWHNEVDRSVAALRDTLGLDKQTSPRISGGEP